MNQYVFLLIGYFLIKPHQSQQPGAAAVQLQRTWFVLKLNWRKMLLIFACIKKITLIKLIMSCENKGCLKM
jgi:hypothetical protein